MTPAPSQPLRPLSGSQADLPARCGFATMRELEAAAVRTADCTAHRFLKGWQRPPAMERDDYLGIARLAAWRATLAFDPSFGGKWSSWVIGQVKHALNETPRCKGYATNNSRSKHQIAVVPLSIRLPSGDFVTETAEDPRAEAAFSAVEARHLAGLLQGALRERLWRVLEDTEMGGMTLKAWAVQEGISESRVWQLAREAKARAREVLEAAK